MNSVSLPLFFGWKTKICYFHVIFSIKKDVFRFQISMYNIGSIMKIVHGAQELLEVVPRKLFVKASSSILNFNITKEISLLNQLEHYKVYLNGLTWVFLDDFTVTVVLDKPYNIGMIEPFQKSNLVEQYLFEGLKAYFFDMVSFYDLDGEKLIGVIFWGSQFDFGV